MPKKIISVLLSVIILIGIPAFSLPAFAADAEVGASSCGIDRTYLCAGDPLRVSNPDNYDLKYFVGDAEITGGAFTLLPQYYENWISVKAYSGETLAAEDKVYFSKLPVLYINTEGSQPITSKEEYLSGDMYLQNNTASDAAMYSGEIKI